MFNWKSTVRLASGYLKEIKLNGYNTAEDASSAARGQTGGGEILLTQKWDEPTQPVQRQYQPNTDNVCDDTADDKYCDDLEEQMYMYHCEKAIREGKEPPTVDEFYDWLEYRFK